MMRRAWLGVLAMALAGCPKAIQAPSTGRADPRELLARLDALDQQRGPMQGDAKLSIESPDAHGVVSVFLAAERPARAHLELMDFFGKPQAIFITDGQRFGLYQAQENRYLEGPASQRAVSQLVPVPLSPEELVAVLLGTMPRISAEARWAGEGSDLHLELSDGAALERLWFDPGGEIARAELSGPREVKVSFSSFERAGAIRTPRKVRIEAAQASAILELKLTGVTYGAAIEEGMFTPEAPEGVPVVTLGEGSTEPRSGPPQPGALDGGR